MRALLLRKPQANFVIPDDIEASHYGPLSGSSFERRVVDVHNAGGLLAKRGSEKLVAVKVCTTCGAAGACLHSRHSTKQA